MTAQEYKEYKLRVASFLEREEIEIISQCGDDYGNSEPFFSWRPCECCGLHKGGDRYDMIATNGFHYEVCVDCLYYLTYGRLDDQTMMDIEG